MKTYCVTFVLCVFFYSGLLSQEVEGFVFKAERYSLNISEIDLTNEDNHILGDTIAKKMILFNDRYTKIIPASATSPSERIDIKKPAIYNSIMKLNKYYSSGVKKNTISKDTAKIEFERCLNVALVVFDKDSEILEKSLKKAKEPALILDIYRKVIIK